MQGSGLSLAIEEDVGEQHVVDTLATSMGLQVSIGMA